jgi:hypothetical protein
MPGDADTDILNLRQLRNFLYTARCSSVSEAAQALNRPRTVVSRSIRELERRLGVNLFDRSVSVLSRQQIHYEERFNMLRTPPLQPAHTSRPGAALLLEPIRRASAAMPL